MTRTPRDISSIKMRVKYKPARVSDPEDYDAWYLSWVALISPDPTGGDILFYRYDDWISVTQGDADWVDVDLGTPEKSVPKEVKASIAAEILSAGNRL